MHLKSCCALLLLAFVASQAAPSPKIIDKNSISDAESDLTNENLPVEDSGANKDRAKKSATTFCVDVRSEKEQEPQQLAIVQSVPAPAPVALVQTAPASVPSALTIVQPAPAPYPSESLSVNLVQPTPQTETVYFQTAPQPHLANLVLQSQPVPQPASPIVVPAPPIPAPSQYQLNILPSAVPQQSSYVVQNQPAAQPVQTVRILQQHPQPQSTVTLIQEPKLETERSKSPIKALPGQLSVVPESNHRDVFQCNCRSDSHLKSRQSALTPQILPQYWPLEPIKNRFVSVKNDLNVPTLTIPATLTTKQTEPRHHHKKVYLPTLDYPIVYNQPSSVIPGYGYSYPFYSSYPSYPLVDYSPNQVYTYGDIPSVVVNTGGPFLGQAQPKDMHSEPNPINSEVGDLIKNQKRETDSVFQFDNSKQNEIQQQEKKSTIMDAVATTVKIGNTK